MGLPIAEGATISASSCSLQDVQAAVNGASDGDTIAIPNGSCSWSGGLSTNKQIIIRAQNYAATRGGTMSRSVVLTNNAGSTPMISLTSGNNYHVGVVGIRFNDGSGTGNYLRLSGTGSKVALVADCSFEYELRNGNNPTNAMIAVLSEGAVFWNTYHNSLRGNNGGAIGGEAIFLNHPRAWTTSSTMGALDANGSVNVYFEDSTAKNVDALLDIDQGSRVVVRKSEFDGSWFLTHGFTSGSYSGGRHVEIYDNQFKTTMQARNMAGRYFWLRAGTVVITGNDAARATDTQSYAGGHVGILDIGDNTSPSGSDGPMQPGWGHSGSADVRDPIYVWGNTGAMGSEVGFNNQSGCWSCVTNSQELVVDQGPKPGWTRFTYPHPARAVVESGVAPPMPPSEIRVESN
jgi:hypothetical protein